MDADESMKVLFRQAEGLETCYIFSVDRMPHKISFNLAYLISNSVFNHLFDLSFRLRSLIYPD